MQTMVSTRLVIVILLGSLLIYGCQREKVDFSAEIKPILNKHCIACHGGVKRNAQFSLLFRHEAIDTAESGKRVIIPGDASKSELINRITSHDPEYRMPYKEEPLKQDEIDVLTRWINEGAEWGDHWAYVPPREVEVPGDRTSFSALSSDEVENWARNPIDNFILEKLTEKGLKPSREADKPTLVRRLYMDIVGLPPTEVEAAAFFNDNSPQAYENLIDRLVTSKHFGEKWASWWLDMARYADTKGYEKDGGRSIWRYRDWIIKAFNQDMPFDQFTTEQLAGDLLPNPTDDQFIATGFHRNTMNNDEGGTDDEEFRVAAVIDRVNTTWEVWQSTTMACVQCHTHPYDPFLHEEYYKAMAFFNNTRDEDTPGEHPTLRMYAAEDQTKLEGIRSWIQQHADTGTQKEIVNFLRTLEPKFHPHAFDEIVNGSLQDNKYLGLRPGGSARIRGMKLDGKSTLIMKYWTGAPGGTVVVRLDSADGEIILNEKIPKAAEAIAFPMKVVTGKHDLYFKMDNPQIPRDQVVCSIDWLAFREALPGEGSKNYKDFNEMFMHLVNTEPDATPVMIENKKDQYRVTQVFTRGNWMVKADSVEPGVPASLNPFPADNKKNRLGLAHWLLAKDNPLTSRAIVNRFWEQIFGAGLVESLEDFGTQGASPTHQELLDWLALRFMNDHQWSMKKLIKDLVMSAAYRQDSRITMELQEKDPYNKLLARGPRVRFSFEQVRDQALAVSGLLSSKMYGKSVMPYQPAGIWSSVYSDEYWKQSDGDDKYRRAVYTYAKRTSPYPSMMMFDGSSREVCISRRIRTNTPLQALVTLNDSSFVVAARRLGALMIKKGKAPAQQINAGYKLLLMRDMPVRKREVLVRLYEDARTHYLNDMPSAKKLTPAAPSAEYAAMTVVANAILNLDEVITKE